MPSVGDLRDAAIATGRVSAYHPRPRKPGQRSDPLSRLRAMRAVGRWLRREGGPGVAIHANGFSELHVVGLAARLSRTPVTVWFHGHEQNPWDRLLGPIWRRLLPDLRLAAVSAVAAAKGVEGGGWDAKRIREIPNPIDPEDVVANGIMISERQYALDGWVATGNAKASITCPSWLAW